MLKLAARKPPAPEQSTGPATLVNLWLEEKVATGTKPTPEARVMLIAIYGWLAESFYTADLKEAKVLIDKLA